MKNGKFAKRGIATKVMLVILAVMLVAGISVGSTLAWLSAQSNEVTNVFTPSDVAIKLDEVIVVDGVVDAEGDRTTSGNTYKVIPGVEYTKDPKVTVLTEADVAEGQDYTDIDVILFVQMTETGSPATYYAYEFNATGWTPVHGETNVWYRVVNNADTNKSFELLTDNKIVVKNTVKKGDMDAAAAAKLTFKAYAVQKVGFVEGETVNVANAWKAAQGLEAAN